MHLRAFTLIALAVLAGSSSLTAEDFFTVHVEPLLKRRCYECHSHGGKIKGGLALDSRSGWASGGDSGPVVVPGELAKSPLIEAVRYTNPDLEMPPKGRLAAAEIAVLEKWVSMGAPDPRGSDRKGKGVEGPDLEKAKKLWAFQPVLKPKAPRINDTSWPLDPADAFILARLQAAKLQPAPDAPRPTWLRRVYLDITGLPPTPEAIALFTADTSPQAHERVVDRLLQSTAFGERWARHWLDLVGYADQIGTSNSIFAEHAWRYRDYVIAAFNRDLPFDRFFRQQIAGDLLPFNSPEELAENIIATGFLVLGDVEIVNVDKLKMELDLVDQQVSKVGTAFLGMTLGCARCHDHKFDAITQADYYGIAGMFRGTDSTYKTKHGVWSSVNTTDLPETARQKAERLHKLAENEARIRAWQVERDRAAQDKKEAEKELASATKEAMPSLGKKRDELNARIKTLESQITHARFFAPAMAQAFAVRDREKPADMRITIRGNPYALGESVKRGVLDVASWSKLPAIPADQSGRVQLADWIADARNPLTARVTVNRIWQKLFGEGLVRSVDYFGIRGDAPTHPELLDHLAARFVSSGWSHKQLIRGLVLSRAYRMSSAHSDLAMARDPDNRLLWRMNRQRLDAEAIRDTMLAVSGALVPSSGGTAMPLEYHENVTGISSDGVNPPAFRLSRMRPIQENERTIYLPVVRIAAQPGSAKLRDVFDFPQPAQFTGKRAETDVPTQALFLLNSDMLRSRAQELAGNLIKTTPDSLARMDELWLRVLNRPVNAAERDEAIAFLDTLRAERQPDSEVKAWSELARALFACNEFLLRL